MGRLRRSRVHRAIRDNQRKFRTRARVKDMDQIHEDIEIVQNGGVLDHNDTTGIYCLQCARYFINDAALTSHNSSKQHKRRIKKMLEPLYEPIQ